MDYNINIGNRNLSGIQNTGASQNVQHQSGEVAGQIKLSELSVGQNVQGRIVVIENDPTVGRVATIDLGENSFVQASLSQDMELTDGQVLLFQVKGTSEDGRITLNPLFENTSANPTISKALMEAGIPDTEDTRAMVKEMMHEGMRIDAGSVQEMYHNISGNPEISMETVVQMAKLHLEITPENAQQFANYQNYHHQIMDGIQSALEQIPLTYEEIAASDGQNAALDFYGNLVKAFGQTGDSDTISAQQQTGDTQSTGFSVEGMMNDRFLQNLQNLLKGNLEGTNADKELQNALRWLNDPSGMGDGSETAKLLQGLSSLYEETAHSSPEVDKIWNALFTSDKFSKLLQNTVEKNWMIDPEDVESKQAVEKLYERLHEQTGALTKALSSASGEQTSLSQTVRNLNQNIDFMNQLNQNFAYLQLPLKMMDRNAHGDLYVYSNKRNMAEAEGEVSAILHLDMDNLGTTDVYVKMKDQNVQSRFYLADDDAMDLIEAHLDELNERLEKRGYHMQAKVMLQTDKEPSDNTVLDTLLQRDTRVSRIAQNSFDARA